MSRGNEKGRDEFRTRLGFIVACIGSAVGMGNIWMFPYRTGKFGGAAFLIPYFIFVILLGFSGVIGEMAFGRSMKTGPLGAFSNAMGMRFGEKGKKWGNAIGMIPVIGSLGIAIGYSVVVGWFLKYLSSAVTGSLTKIEDMGAYFGGLAVDFGSVGWQMLGLALTFLVMALGVTKGIEKMNKVMMPVFFLFFIILLIAWQLCRERRKATAICSYPNGSSWGISRPGYMPWDRPSSPCRWQDPARLYMEVT